VAYQFTIFGLSPFFFFFPFAGLIPVCGIAPERFCALQGVPLCPSNFSTSVSYRFPYHASPFSLFLWWFCLKPSLLASPPLTYLSF